MGVVTRKTSSTLLTLLMLASTATLAQSLSPFESPQYRALATVCQWPLGLIHFRTLILIHPR